MAARIRLLSSALADQIAAGEVVERPASVVKELVENALDAGARRVEVEIERGGLGVIEVTDDGGGMSPEEAHLALRRHATSKLQTADELFALTTFGFRGEALPSIASVAELTLTTRRAEDTAGYELVVRAGEVLSTREVGAPVGTRVVARGLFSTVPARLKFQKATSTESGHVVELLVRTALGAADVHVRLRVDGRIVVDLPPHASLAERAQAVVRRNLGKQVRLASTTLREGAITVEVHIAPLEESVQSARRVHLLINQRVVRDRGLLSALQVGLGEHLPRGRHPLAVVSVTLPAVDVDVNVHPQKLEVRLARAGEVHATLRHAVRRAVEGAGWSTETNEQHYAPTEHAPLVAREYTPFAPFEMHAPDEDAAPLARDEERGQAYELVAQMAEGAALFVPPLIEAVPPRFVGEVPGGYLAFVDGRGLWLLDQHVASALCVLAAPPESIVLSRPIALSPAFAAAASALNEVGVRVEREMLVGLPAGMDDAQACALELEAAFIEGGADHARDRLVGMLALSPADSIDANTADALLTTLVDEAPLALLTERRFRGRRAAIFIGRSEIGRRLDA